LLTNSVIKNSEIFPLFSLKFRFKKKNTSLLIIIGRKIKREILFTIIMMIKRNASWIKWADYFDAKVSKIIEENPGKWLSLEIEVNQDTWDEIKDVPEDQIEKLTLLEYLRGYTFKMVRFAKDIKINPDENLKGDYLEVHILKMSK